MQNKKADINFFALAKRMKRPLILDGAMGSLLQQRGVKMHSALWMSLANLENPEIVKGIHDEYIEAGADIITTNTFRTNPLAINRLTSKKIKGLVRKAVNIARAAAGDLPVLIAGSNAPAEDCYQVKRTITKKELEANHKSHIEELYSNGCHFILNETQSHFDEIKIISNYCSDNSIPYVISLFFGNDLNILSGENLSEIIKFIKDRNALAIGFNCILPSTMIKTKRLIKNTKHWGFYLNCGDGAYTDDNIECGISPKEYAKHVAEYTTLSPSFIGACCGSGPEHIRELKNITDGNIKSQNSRKN